MNRLVLEARGVTKVFRDGARDIQPFEAVDLSLSLGQTLAIVGPSGAGKSTLLHLLGGLESATHGEVHLMGHCLNGLSDRALTRLRNEHLGFVYQFHHLLAEFSALDNVAMPLRIRRTPARQAHAEAAAMLEQVGLGHRLTHPPSRLSGGERQRVAIARAMVTHPAVLLADEPTGNLDQETAAQVFDCLLSRVRAAKTALVIVTHDLSLASACDDTLTLRASSRR